MKTILAISLSFLVFFQSAGLGVADILMLDKLVEHAQYHSENYGDDFFTFFEKHYGVLKSQHQKNDKEENHAHDKLPFQHTSCNHLVTEVILAAFEIPVLKPAISTKGTSNFHYQNLYSSLEKSAIFQPPQFA